VALTTIFTYWCVPNIIPIHAQHHTHPRPTSYHTQHCTHSHPPIHPCSSTAARPPFTPASNTVQNGCPLHSLLPSLLPLAPAPGSPASCSTALASAVSLPPTRTRPCDGCTDAWRRGSAGNTASHNCTRPQRTAALAHMHITAGR
jgi:hypothetical protein